MKLGFDGIHLMLSHWKATVKATLDINLQMLKSAWNLSETFKYLSNIVSKLITLQLLARNVLTSFKDSE